MLIAKPCIGTPLFLLTLLLSVIAAAAVPADSEACVALSDPQARLACYDQAHARPEQASPAQQEETEPSARTGSAARASGFGAEQLPDPPGSDNDEAELIDRISAMGTQTTGRHWFRLENDQLWAQVSPERTTLTAGDSIRINRSLLGTYHLRRADGGSRSTAVRRLE